MITPFSFFGPNYFWDSDAVAYNSNMPDAPQQAQRAVNNLVLWHKNNSLWTKLKYAIISPFTLDEDQVLRELKNNVVRASGITYASENVVTNFPSGYNFQNDTTLANFINVGRTYTQIGITTLSACHIHKEKRDFPAATAYAYGVIQTTTQRSLLIPKNAANNIAGQMFSQTNGVATTSGTETNGRGVYSLNRTANNYLELVKDGTIKDTDTSIVAATLPTANPYIGVTQGTTNYKPGIIPFWAVYDGLTNAERLLMEQGWANYESDMNRSGDYTKQIILDGNSLSLRGAHRTFRKALYTLGMNNYNTHNTSVAGIDTDQLITRYPTYVAPLYDATLAKNIYIGYEIGNSLVADTVADVKQQMIDLIALADATGFTTVCMVPQTRANTGAKTDTQWYLDMDEMQGWVLAGSSGADYIIDCSSSNLMIRRSDYASDAAFVTACIALTGNGTYFTDGVHLTKAGYDLRGLDMATTLQSIL